MRRSVEQERLKEQRTKVENKHCTFQPVTNKNNLNTQEDPFERLSKLRENHKLRRMREEQEKLKEEAELRGCTFKPEINNYKNEVQPRYMITNEERNLSPRLRLMLKDQYTFIPRVKGLIKGMNSAKEYIKQNPFERLSKPKEVSEPDEPEEEIEISPKHSIVSSSTEYKEYGDSFSSRPFFERQALYELMKAEKKSYHENMPSVGPEICERSKKMVKKGFFERNQEMIDKKEATLKNSQKPSGCTFQPRITQKAKLVKNRSFTEMSYGDSKKKETKIQTMKQEIEQNFKAMNNLGLSHTKLYSNVGSTIKILDDPDSYVARLRDLQRNKEQKIKAIKDEREKQELSACTHAPVTIEAPSYVKQIARNMALLKAERAAYEEESKPDWR